MELAAIIIALIVPIGVAVWTVRSSAKDTAKQIAALEESTTKQIVPSINEQNKIVDNLDKLEASIQNLEAQLSLREKQYDYYQNKLLSVN